MRVYFKTGAWFDLVPEGSIASGSKIYVNEDEKISCKFIQPDIDKLWNEYKVKAGEWAIRVWLNRI